MISKSRPLILASASPRRKALLRQIGLPFFAVHSDLREEHDSGDPSAVACSLAQGKATHVFLSGHKGWVLGADTIVVVDHSILGKPKNEADATRMLSALSGKEHRVITGVSLLNPAGTVAYNQATSTLVSVIPLSAGEVEGYIATGEPFGKAGGYAIQGIGAFMIAGIQGSYTNVVGLPVCAVITALKKAGALGTFPISHNPAADEFHPV